MKVRVRVTRVLDPPCRWVRVRVRGEGATHLADAVEIAQHSKDVSERQVHQSLPMYASMYVYACMHARMYELCSKCMNGMCIGACPCVCVCLCAPVHLCVFERMCVRVRLFERDRGASTSEHAYSSHSRGGVGDWDCW